MKSLDKIPLISIITVVFNSVSTLEDTLTSVINQEQDLFEYWIIDGGSTDGSVDIIRRYEKFLAGWISEPDTGIYDAMNKGIDLAKGKWIYFLGADDLLSPDVLEEIKNNLDDKYLVVFGQVLFDNNYKMSSYLGKRTMLQNTLHHQSAFYNSRVFFNFRYDSSLKILADYELNLQLFVKKSPTLYISKVIAICSTGGASSEFNPSLQETNLVRSRTISSPIKNSFFSFILTLYYFQKKLRYSIYGHRI